MNVVLYLRYSSDKQNEQSIEGQQRICTEYCNRNNMQIVGIYIDRALSASKDTDKRKDFQKMIRDSEKKNFEAVIVYKLDRFARNRYDSATYKNKLAKNGVKVISATENISDNPEGIILEAVLEGMAEFYSKELSQKVTRGMNETALKGNSCGGSIPLGYKVENKKFVIDPTTAPIVTQVFEMFTQGKKIEDICKYFNDRGLRNSKGKEFTKNSFSTMLRNERYVGIYKYKDIRIEGGIPAIISPELFEAAQARIKTNKQAPARNAAKIDYLLSGKIFCGHCSSPMSGEYGTGENGTRYYYYACSQKKKNHSCNKKNVKKEWIEETVLQDLITLLTDDVIEEIADIAVREAEKEYKENEELKMYLSQLEEVNRSMDNIVNFIEKGSFSTTLVNRLKELEEQKDKIKAAIDDLSRDMIVIEKEFVIWWLNQFVNGNLKDEHFKKLVFDMLLHSVTVYDEPDGWYRFRITYNVTSMNTKEIKCSTLPPDGSPKIDKFR